MPKRNRKTHIKKKFLFPKHVFLQLNLRGSDLRASTSVFLIVFVVLFVLVVVLPDIGHRGLHPGPAVLGPTGARGQHPIRTVGQVTARTGGDTRWSVTRSAACAKDRPALQGGLGSFYYTKRNGKFHTFVNTESQHSVISFTLFISCSACPLGHNQKNEGNIGKTTIDSLFPHLLLHQKQYP